MISETIKINVEGSMPYARLYTYIWEHSDEMPTEKDHSYSCAREVDMA